VNPANKNQGKNLENRGKDWSALRAVVKEGGGGWDKLAGLWGSATRGTRTLWFTFKGSPASHHNPRGRQEGGIYSRDLPKKKRKSTGENVLGGPLVPGK